MINLSKASWLNNWNSSSNSMDIMSSFSFPWCFFVTLSTIQLAPTFVACMYQLCNLRIFVGRLFTSSGLTRGLPYWYLYATSLTGKNSNLDKYWAILIPWAAAASPYCATTSGSYCSSAHICLTPHWFGKSPWEGRKTVLLVLRAGQQISRLHHYCSSRLFVPHVTWE